MLDLALHPVQPVTGGIRRVTLAMLDLDHRADDRAARVDDLNVMHIRSIAQRKVVLASVDVRRLTFNDLLITPLVVSPKPYTTHRRALSIAHHAANRRHPDSRSCRDGLGRPSQRGTLGQPQPRWASAPEAPELGEASPAGGAVSRRLQVTLRRWHGRRQRDVGRSRRPGHRRCDGCSRFDDHRTGWCYRHVRSGLRLRGSSGNQRIDVDVAQNRLHLSGSVESGKLDRANQTGVPAQSRPRPQQTLPEMPSHRCVFGA